MAKKVDEEALLAQWRKLVGHFMSEATTGKERAGGDIVFSCTVGAKEIDGLNQLYDLLIFDTPVKDVLKKVGRHKIMFATPLKDAESELRFRLDSSHTKKFGTRLENAIQTAFASGATHDQIRTVLGAYSEGMRVGDYEGYDPDDRMQIPAMLFPTNTTMVDFQHTINQGIEAGRKLGLWPSDMGGQFDFKFIALTEVAPRKDAKWAQRALDGVTKKGGQGGGHEGV